MRILIVGATYVFKQDTRPPAQGNFMAKRLRAYFGYEERAIRDAIDDGSRTPAGRPPFSNSGRSGTCSSGGQFPRYPAIAAVRHAGTTK